MSTKFTGSSSEDFKAYKAQKLASLAKEEEEFVAFQAKKANAEEELKLCKKRKAEHALKAYSQDEKRRKRQDELVEIVTKRKGLKSKDKKLKKRSRKLKRQIKKSEAKQADMTEESEELQNAVVAAEKELRKCGGDPDNLSKSDSEAAESDDSDDASSEVDESDEASSEVDESGEASSEVDESDEASSEVDEPEDYKKCKGCNQLLQFTDDYFTPTAMECTNPRCAACDKAYRNKPEVKKRTRILQAERRKDTTCDSYINKCSLNGITMRHYEQGKRLKRGEELTGTSSRQFIKHIESECNKNNLAHPNETKMTSKNRGTGRSQWQRQSIVPYRMFCDQKTGFPDPNSKFPNLKSFEKIVCWWKNQTVVWGRHCTSRRQCTLEEREALVRAYHEAHASESAAVDAQKKEVDDIRAEQDAEWEAGSSSTPAASSSSSSRAELVRPTPIRAPFFGSSPVAHT